MRTNQNGLTFSEWCSAANVAYSKTDSTSASVCFRAWEEGQDPTEYIKRSLARGMREGTTVTITTRLIPQVVVAIRQRSNRLYNMAHDCLPLSTDSNEQKRQKATTRESYLKLARELASEADCLAAIP